MAGRRIHIALLATLLVCCMAGCGRKGRVIPPSELSDIYYDMFVSDQWLRDHRAAKRTADTTFFYEPIFRRHGYSFKDYDASVNYYLNQPEKYIKIVQETTKKLEKELKRLEDIKARIDEINAFNASICGYMEKAFELDTLRFSDTLMFWPAASDTTLCDTSAVDTTARDTVAADSLRRDSVARAPEALDFVVADSMPPTLKAGGSSSPKPAAKSKSGGRKSSLMKNVESDTIKVNNHFL